MKTQFQAAGLTLDLNTRVVDAGGKQVGLFPNEARLLALLMERAGEAVARKDIMEGVWGNSYMGDTRIIDVNVCWLRQKLRTVTETTTIETMRGFGYKLRGCE